MGNRIIGFDIARWSKRRVRVSHRDHVARKFEKFLLAFVERPIQPGQFVVLTIGIVIALLRHAKLVAAEHHRHAMAEQDRSEQIATCLEAPVEHSRFVTWSLDTKIESKIVVGAIAIVLAVGFIVFLVVGNKIGRSNPS